MGKGLAIHGQPFNGGLSIHDSTNSGITQGCLGPGAVSQLQSSSPNVQPSVFNTVASTVLGILQMIHGDVSSNIQYKRALEQWERENAYNSPTAQMERFKAAGLNPDLIYGQQNTAGSAQAMNDLSQPNDISSAFTRGVQADLSNRMAESQIMLNQSAAEANFAKADESDQHGLWYRRDRESMRWQDQLSQQQSRWYAAQVDETSWRIEQIFHQCVNMDQDSFGKMIDNYTRHEYNCTVIDAMKSDMNLNDNQVKEIKARIKEIYDLLPEKINYYQSMASANYSQGYYMRQLAETLWDDIYEACMYIPQIRESTTVNEYGFPVRQKGVPKVGKYRMTNGSQLFEWVSRIADDMTRDAGRMIQFNFGSFRNLSPGQNVEYEERYSYPNDSKRNYTVHGSRRGRRSGY